MREIAHPLKCQVVEIVWFGLVWFGLVLFGLGWVGGMKSAFITTKQGGAMRKIFVFFSIITLCSLGGDLHAGWFDSLKKPKQSQPAKTIGETPSVKPTPSKQPLKRSMQITPAPMQPSTKAARADSWTPPLTDTDGDGVYDSSDNCPGVSNPSQADLNTDGIGDICPESMALGAGYTCVLRNNGTVKCWGYNPFGQLGNGTTTNSMTPVTVSGLANVTAISAGEYRACALLEDGKVKCWGSGECGALGYGGITNSSTPVEVTGLSGATAISVGSLHTCALLSDGGVKCWGAAGPAGLIGDGDDAASCRLSPVSVLNVAMAQKISARNDHTCALLTGGSIKCWGGNHFGALGDGTYDTPRTTAVSVLEITGAKDIGTGYGYTCAILADDSIKCWGRNGYGELGNGTTLNSNVPVPVLGISGASSIALGLSHSHAVLEDGSAKSWGHNSVAGYLGDGTEIDRTTPVFVSGLSGATAISAGGVHTCALLFNGSIKCWGENPFGQLGDGTTMKSATPVSVTILGETVITPLFEVPATY